MNDAMDLKTLEKECLEILPPGRSVGYLPGIAALGFGAALEFHD